MFNARKHFDDPGEPVGAYKKHDFGGTIGGPIIKNRTFLFSSEEIRKQSVPGFCAIHTPTPAERGGISALSAPRLERHSFIADPGTQSVQTYASCLRLR
jgi:hypothetical protein